MPRDKFMMLSSEGDKRKSGARHLRRKAEKLAKRYPAETAKALKMLEEREGKKQK